MTLAPGTTLGPYRLARLLGVGGMGEVYAALDTRLDRHVAVKVLPERSAADPERRTRFTLEARAISALNHPHIATLYDVGEHDGTSYLVMELVEGETLAERLARGPLPLREALEYATQIAHALEAAHESGIVHRDLKPANVMITKTGVKLLDFGLAKLRDRPASTSEPQQTTHRSALTTEGAVLGTAQYMAPEQLEGREVDARTDVFGFGALLYEMLSGKPAFQADSAAGLTAAILMADPPALEALPPALDHLIRVCLEKKPSDRWHTAHDVCKQLEGIQASSSPSAVLRPTATDAPPTIPRRRHLYPWVATGVLGIGLAAGLAAYFGRGGDDSLIGGRLASSVAVLPFTTLSTSQEDAVFVDGMHQEVIDKLAKIRQLKVIDRVSVMRFRDETKRPPLADIADALDVESVMSASVRFQDRRFKLTVSLVDAKTGVAKWQYDDDRDRSDAFAVQSEIALGIASALSATLGREEAERLARVQTTDAEALESYFEARRYAFDYPARAEQLLDIAIEREPRFSLALAWKATIYARRVGLPIPYGEELANADFEGTAKKLAEQALAIDPSETMAHLALGVMNVAQYRFADALEHTRDAVRAAPGDAGALNNYAGAAGNLGDHAEAVAALNKSSELAPYWQEPLQFLCREELRVHHFEDAVKACGNALELAPRNAPLRLQLAFSLVASGDKAAALTELKHVETDWRAAAMPDGLFASSELAYGYALADASQRAEELAMLYDEFASTLAPESGHRLVIALARRDEAEALLALQQVVEAIEGSQPARPFNQIIPIWHNSANDPMLELPRFAALRTRIGNQVVRRGNAPAD